MRMLLPLALIALTPLAPAGHAQTPELFGPVRCADPNASWTLDVDGDTAQFSLGRTSDLTLMLTTVAQGAQWPRALTFIGRGDSVIAIIDADQCRFGPEGTSVQVLTQRGETPLLLTGCCVAN